MSLSTIFSFLLRSVNDRGCGPPFKLSQFFLQPYDPDNDTSPGLSNQSTPRPMSDSSNGRSPHSATRAHGIQRPHKIFLSQPHSTPSHHRLAPDGRSFPSLRVPRSTTFYRLGPCKHRDNCQMASRGLFFFHAIHNSIWIPQMHAPTLENRVLRAAFHFEKMKHAPSPSSPAVAPAELILGDNLKVYPRIAAPPQAGSRREQCSGSFLEVKTY